MSTTLIIPGLKSSGPQHWQSWFEDRIPSTIRVSQIDWDDANLAEWSARIRREISRTPGRLFVVAHSFGVLAAVQAASDHAERIAGALLVAPADPDKFAVADLLPQEPLAFPSVVVAGTNDPWMTLERAAHWADIWGSDFVNLGAAGHVNVESGFGPWPEGLSLFERLKRSAVVRHRFDLLESAVVPHSRRPSRRDAGLNVPGAGSTARGPVRLHTIHQRRDLWQAAQLLEEAGWQVTPPPRGVNVTRA